MKGILGWTWLLIAVAFLAACGGTVGSPTPEVNPLHLQPVPWGNGSSAKYIWQDPNQKDIGTSDFAFTLQDGSWIIHESDSVSKLEQKLTMVIDQKRLTPISSVEIITDADITATVRATYQEATVEIKTVMNGAEQPTTLDIPPNALANEQLVMTLRALPFSEAYSITYVDVMPKNGLKEDVVITVQSQEDVTVPAGTFRAWRVVWTTKQGTQTGWYEVKAPHRLLQYDNGSERMLLAQ